MQRRSFLKNAFYASAITAVSGKIPLLAQTPSKNILVLGALSMFMRLTI
jgi:hypothetical protein